MDEADIRQERIREKIDASQERMKRDSPLPSRAIPADRHPPEDYRSLAGEHPWATVAAGIGIGLLAGALLPKRFGGKLGKRMLTAATVAGELGLTLSRQAGAATVKSKAKTRGMGAALAREAIRIATSRRK